VGIGTLPCEIAPSIGYLPTVTPLTRHPGLDPGSSFSASSAKTAGPRVKPGVTEVDQCIERSVFLISIVAIGFGHMVRTEFSSRLALVGEFLALSAIAQLA
jgi:hypothetical protein